MIRRGVFCAVLLVALGGCGNAISDDDLVPAGVAGVSVDEAGSPRIDLQVCGEGVTELRVVRDREGLSASDENPEVATYRHDEPLQGSVQVDLADPGAGWTPTTPLELEPGRGYLVSAGGPDTETSQVWVRTDDLPDLAPGRIYVDGDDPDSPDLQALTPADFAASEPDPCR